MIVAVKNEEKYIERCLESLVQQNFDHDKYQIIVADGMSNDRTKEIVKRIMERNKYMRIKIYINKKEWQAVGRNIAIMNEKESKLLAYIDGHCIADSNWLANLYDKLSVCNDSIAGVGSVYISPKDESFIGFAIEKVFHSLIGGFGSCFRSNSKKDTNNGGAYFLYRRHCLEEAGLYDEEMKCGEDFLLNFKIKKLGYNLLVEPKAIVYYYKRNSLSSFAKQMYNYGFAKGVIWNKQKNALGIGAILPSLFLIYLIFMSLISFYIDISRILLIITLGIYLLAIIASSLAIILKERKPSYFVVLPFLYGLEHFPFAIGYINGVLSGGWKR